MKANINLDTIVYGVLFPFVFWGLKEGKKNKRFSKIIWTKILIYVCPASPATAMPLYIIGHWNPSVGIMTYGVFLFYQEIYTLFKKKIKFCVCFLKMFRPLKGWYVLF